MARFASGPDRLPEYVYLRRHCDKLLSDVADSFSLDAWVFELRNTPMKCLSGWSMHEIGANRSRVRNLRQNPEIFQFVPDASGHDGGMHA